MTDHAFVNVVIPFAPGHCGAVDQVLRGLTDSGFGNRPAPQLESALDRCAIFHFLSITAVQPRCPAEPLGVAVRGNAHLIVEASADVGAEESITVLCAALDAELRAVLSAARVELGEESLESFLLRHSRGIGARWGSDALGQVFSGSPGMSVRRILAEDRLAGRLSDVVDAAQAHRGWHALSGRQRLELVRHRLWSEGTWKWAFVAEAAPCLQGDPHNPWNPELSVFNPQARKAAFSALHNLLSPLYLPFALIALATILLTWRARSPVTDLLWTAGTSIGIATGVLIAVATLSERARWLRFLWAILALAIVVAAALALGGWHDGFADEVLWCLHVAAALGAGFVCALAGFFLVGWIQLRKLEATDPVEDVTPAPSHVESLMKLENFCAQNHLASVSRLKPGLLRRLTLRIAFLVVGTGRFVGPPGFLGKNGVIHFARWMRLPGTDQLLFWSNYDNTWDSYVGDFIADAPTGVTAIWSNCVGFPRTRTLYGAGAQDRDRLMRWARRQQHGTTFWYSAYRSLTADRIRINAAIRQGFASAESDDDVRNCFALLFGSRPAAADALRTSQIPTLVFGALSKLRFAESHAIQWSGDTAKCKAWLKAAAEEATYGEMLPGQKSATVVALSATGLQKLGLPAEALATFPVAFQQGMWPEWRARALRDTGSNAPDAWTWGSLHSRGEWDRTIDVFLVIYGRDESDLERVRRKLLQGAERLGILGGVHSLVLTPLLCEQDAAACGESRFQKEPFGFADGVSQPILRGTPRSRTWRDPNDLVSPGEIVLGYPDNLGKIPPSPCLPDSYDPHHLLPDARVEIDPPKKPPEFSRYQGGGWRDLGANGTFLVVRQLEQDPEALERWLEKALQQLEPIAIASTGRGGRTAIKWARAEQEAVASIPLPRPRSEALSEGWHDPALRARVKEAIAAKMIGRWRDGTSLVRHPLMPGGQRGHGPDNDFLLGAEDQAGLACPFGAHIRRANPRDTRYPGSLEEIGTINRHRILRVGRVYGERVARTPPCALDPARPQGLLFMCLNADIERQFEFIQKVWLMNPNLHGLDNEVDPLLGVEPRTFTVPTDTGVLSLRIEEPFVTVRGGGYFFLPGRTALQYLAA